MPSRKIKVRKSRRPRKVKSRKARKKVEKSKSPKARRSRSPKGVKSRSPKGGKKLPARGRVVTMADLMSDLPSTNINRKPALPNKLMANVHGAMSEIIWDTASADGLDDIKNNIRESFKKKFPGNAKNSKLAKAVIKLAIKLFAVFDRVSLDMIHDWLGSYKGQVEEGPEGIKRVALVGKSNKGVRGDFAGALEELRQVGIDSDEEQLAIAILGIYPHRHKSDISTRIAVNFEPLLSDIQDSAKINLLEVFTKLDKNKQIKIVEKMNKRGEKHWDTFDELLHTHIKRLSPDKPIIIPTNTTKVKRTIKRLIDLVPEFKELERLQNRVTLRILPKNRLERRKDYLRKILRNVGVNFDDFRQVVKKQDFLSLIQEIYELNEALKKVQTATGTRFISRELAARRDSVVKDLHRLGIDHDLFVRKDGKNPALEVQKSEYPIDFKNSKSDFRDQYSILLADPIPSVKLSPSGGYAPRVRKYIDIFTNRVLKPERNFLLNLPMSGLEERQDVKLQELKKVIEGILYNLFENTLIQKNDIPSQLFLEKDLKRFISAEDVGLLAQIERNSRTLGEYLKQVADLTLFLRPSTDDSGNYFRITDLLGRTPHEAGEILRSKLLYKRVTPLHFLNMSVMERFPLLDRFVQDDERLRSKIFDESMGKIIQETEREKGLLVNALIRHLDPSAKSGSVPVVLGINNDARKKLEEGLQLLWHDSCQDIDDYNKVLYMEEVLNDDNILQPVIFCFNILDLHEGKITRNPHTGNIFDTGFIQSINDLDADAFKAKKLALQSKSVIKKATPNDLSLYNSGNQRIAMRGMSDTMDSTWVAQGLYRAFKIFEKDLLYEDDKKEDEDSDKKEDDNYKEEDEEEDEEDEEDDLGFLFSTKGGARCESCGKNCKNFLCIFRDHKGSCIVCTVCTNEKCIVKVKL